MARTIAVALVILMSFQQAVVAQGTRTNPVDGAGKYQRVRPYIPSWSYCNWVQFQTADCWAAYPENARAVNQQNQLATENRATEELLKEMGFNPSDRAAYWAVVNNEHVSVDTMREANSIIAMMADRRHGRSPASLGDPDGPCTRWERSGCDMAAAQGLALADFVERFVKSSPSLTMHPVLKRNVRRLVRKLRKTVIEGDQDD